MPPPKPKIAKELASPSKKRNYQMLTRIYPTGSAIAEFHVVIHRLSHRDDFVKGQNRQG
jgi:hypothetical protein